MPAFRWSLPVSRQWQALVTTQLPAPLLRTPPSRRSNLDNELPHLLASQDGEALYPVSSALSHNGNNCRYQPRWKHRPVRGLQRKDNLEIRPTLPV